MSNWITDVDGDLVNLDQMENVKLLELIEPEDPKFNWAVIARAPSRSTAGEEYWIFIADKEGAEDCLNQLKERLIS